jgi:hypothetical protein
MNRHRLAGIREGLSAAALVGLFAAAVVAKGGAAPVRYTASAINMNAPARAMATTVSIVVDRWSTDEERERLRTTLVEQRQHKLFKALQAMPKVGSIRTPDSLSYDLHYARRVPGADGAERVVLLTDRYVTYWEVANAARTLDYPFMVFELRSDSAGHGEGKLTVATKIIWDPETKQVTLENYDAQPVRLTDVRREGK